MEITVLPVLWAGNTGKFFQNNAEGIPQKSMKNALCTRAYAPLCLAKLAKNNFGRKEYGIF